MDDGQILKQIRPAKRKTSRGLLFLGDGFVDRALFDQKVKDFVDALFDATTAPQPFHRLKDSFEIWSAFTPSDSKTPGITIGVPLGISARRLRRRRPRSSPQFPVVVACSVSTSSSGASA